MTLLHDAYTALLSGLTHRTGNEIHWHDKHGCPITVEPVDVERESYLVRRYNDDGILCGEEGYSQGKIHGKRISLYLNGQKCWEADYHQGQLHGKCMGWYENGQLNWKINYIQDQRHGLSMGWYKNGNCRNEKYYINGRSVTREEWNGYNESTT